jgi:hypothetical protein
MDGEDYVFTNLMEGAPCVEVEVLRIPRVIVSEIVGG